MHTVRHTATHAAIGGFLMMFFGGVAVPAALGAEYVPLVALPQFDQQGTGLADYFNQIYMVCVAIGSMIAFIKISIAGVKWSMSDVVTDKSEAKNDIRGALLGLVILLIPFVVLNTIYPGLTSLDILRRANSIQSDTPVNANLDPTGGYAGNGTPVSNICDVRNGVIPPQGCIPGTLSLSEQQLAVECTRLGGTYSIPTRTCVYSGSGQCTVLPQNLFTATRQLAVQNACGGPDKTGPLEPVPGSTLNNVLQMCCL